MEKDTEVNSQKMKESAKVKKVRTRKTTSVLVSSLYKLRLNMSGNSCLLCFLMIQKTQHIHIYFNSLEKSLLSSSGSDKKKISFCFLPEDSGGPL